MRVGLLFADPYDLQVIAGQLPGLELLHWPDCRELATEELLRRCRSVAAVVTSRQSPPLPTELIQDRGHLRLLAHCHGSVKHLVQQGHLDAGLLVSNWGEEVFGVAEAALALTLMCLKRLPWLDRLVRSDWQDDRRIHEVFPLSLRGRDVGIYGYGPIGRAYAGLVQAFGGRVAIYDPYATAVPAEVRVCASLDELFATCQVISIHCGLNDATRGSVNAARLALLPQGAVLINTARGPIIVEDDLVAALQARRLVAGLDVIENEKRWAQSALSACDNAVLTGHKAANGGKGRPPGEPAPPRGLPDFVVRNLRALAAGETLINLIAPHEYARKS
jgi:D-3-phosphoglycerate dehydrogenase